MASFLINGITVIDLKISELIVLTFGLPATTPSAFFTTNLVGNLASLLGVSADKIRRVYIISANNDTRVRRQAVNLGTILLRVEIRNDPPRSLSAGNQTASEEIANITSSLINGYQSNETQQLWANNALTGGAFPVSLSVQEYNSRETVELSVVSRLVLITSPSSCRLQSACDVQPKLVAYDASGKVIDKLGSKDQPWQVIGVVVGQAGVNLIGPIANYSNGQTQYTNFGIAASGSYSIEFRFLTPSGVSNAFVASTNLIVTSSSVSVNDAVLAAVQNENVAVVSVNERFNLSVIIVDKISKVKIGNIQWSGFTWTAAVSLYTSLQHKCNGTLNQTVSSRVIVDTTAGTITATDLSISAVGMYIITMTLRSSNNQYSITMTSNGILVKKASTVLNEYEGFPPSNITFKGDFDALVSNSRLEITRAAIYNYLKYTLRMPVNSDLVLRKGSIIAGFSLSATNIDDAANVQAGVKSLTVSDTEPIESLKVQSVNIEGKSTEVPDDAGSDSSKTGMIIGICVGVLGAVAVAAGSAFGIHKYQVKKKGQRLLNENDVEASAETNTNTPPQSNNNNSTVTRRTSVTPPEVPKPSTNAPQASSANGQRVPSAALSITTLGLENHAPSPMPPVELISFK